MNELNRPYVAETPCGFCGLPLASEERREGGWLYVTLSCACGFRKTVTFSPFELAERERRRAS